jgi:hypothetical protein
MHPSVIRCIFVRTLAIAFSLVTPTTVHAQGVVNAVQGSRIVEPLSASDTRTLRAQGDTPTEYCRKQFEEALKDSVESFGCYWGRMKLETSVDADRFFGAFEVGNAIGLRLGEAQTVLYTELLSDNLFLSSRLGYARLGFATQVVAQQDSIDDGGNRTVDQFFQGGGNAMLYAALPLTVWINYAVDTAKGPLRQLNSFATLAVTGDVPKLGTSATEAAGSVRAGLQTDLTWRSHNERLGLYFNLRGNYVRGLSDAFYRNLLGPDVAVAKWGMVAGDYAVGVDLSKLIRVGVSGGVSTQKSVSSKARLSVQLLKQK